MVEASPERVVMEFIQEVFVFHVGAPGARSEGIAAEIIGGDSGTGDSKALLFEIRVSPDTGANVNHLPSITEQGGSIR